MEDRFKTLRENCYGRRELQETLQQKYDLAAADAPQFVVLLGPTGFGKTRLAQELYRWLATERDPATPDCPHGYWPDSFVSDREKDSVNPRFDEIAKPKIPFLWWGLRFREEAEPWEALNESLHWLGVHSVQMAQHREMRNQDMAAWYQLFGMGVTIAGLVPILSTATNWISLAKEAYDVVQRNAERSAKQIDERESVAAANARINAERAQQILNTLGMFLDSQGSDASTVPVVLMLDDAHWMDANALQIVRQLWTQATANHQKLLIVATHWDDEWKLHLRGNTANERGAQKLAQFVSYLSSDSPQNVTLASVGPVATTALRKWVACVFPALTEQQSQLLIDKARALEQNADGDATEAGSPRVLEEMMKWLLERPNRFFEDGDCNGKLLPSAIEEIQTTIHDLRDIVKQRFLGLSSDLRLTLGWSSLQGLRFLNELSFAVAEQLDFGPDKREFAVLIQRAEDPHGWVERLRQQNIDPGRFNLCEFRSNVFCEVVQNNLDFPRSQEIAIRSAITETLNIWMLEGRFDCPQSVGENGNNELRINDEDLTIPERRDALRMAITRFRPVNPTEAMSEDWSRYGSALVRLIQIDTSGPLWGEPIFWEQAERTAIEFANARPQGWPLEAVEVSQQILVADVLRDMHEFDLAFSILESLNHQLSRTEIARTRALVAERLAIVSQRRGDLADAMVLYQESLGLCRGIVTEFGRSPQSLRDVSVSLDKTADMMRALGLGTLEIAGETYQAIDLYVESLGLRRGIVTEFGRSPESLRDIFVSQSRFVVLAIADEQPNGAIEPLRECLKILDEIEARGWADSRTVADRNWADSMVNALLNNGDSDESS
ncbi:ATP-binding protein [Blastopirellula retiformator]|uniref:Orc1-like AAA ATPase domain-containing protein n=1 Tax=Blastopirellula retiformator TaxID=2527970 RepID=A0A5C5VL55_9BACT|nr:ATP-binding protein [Blastopirellula retiformator]TWT39334.1 hypothetical protein Enr8_10320 [Blastopirellula retiformator]